MIYIAWNHISSNPGDQAVTLGTRNLIERFTSEEITLLDFKKDEPPVIPRSGVVIYGGGEHLFSNRQFWPRTELLFETARSMVFPSTFGPFNAADRIAFRALRDVPVAARDSISARLASSIFGKPVPALLDPAFFLPVKFRKRTDYTVFAPRLESIGLRPGTYRFGGDVLNSRAFGVYLGEIGKTTGRRIVAAHSKLDIDLCQSLSRETGAEYFRPETLDDLLKLYSGASRVVASRFHALVFGLMMGKEVTPLPWEAHGPKIPGMMEMIEAKPIKELKAETLEWIETNLKKLCQ